jgi:starch-binding outer membrane protein, SusD/RagB family
MKIRTKLIAALSVVTAAIIIFIACKKSFLDQLPQGVYDEASLANRKGINGMLINAYATLDGQSGTWYAGASNWLWGSVRGGDAYKGSEPSDQIDGNPVMRFELTSNNPYVLNKWNGTFDGIGQANLVLKTLPKVTDLTDAEKLQIEAEAKFLRAHHHFEGKKSFNNIPYIDETVTDYKVPNTTNGTDYVDIWPQIEADLTFAYNNLAEIKPNIGRVNKWAAACYLAKAYMFQKKYTAAKALYDVILVSGKNSKGDAYDMTAQYHDNFKVTTENNKETVFAVQASYGDGSNTNGNYDNALNYPHSSSTPGAGCCGFFQPSQSMLNSYKTTAAGLPDPDNYNSTNVTSDEALLSSQPFVPYAGTLDPRIDWSVGRRGIPYLDWGPHPGRDWIRQVNYGGPYSPKKNVFYKSELNATSGSVGWGWNNTSLNYPAMRYADVLLMAAEAEIEVGSLDVARTLINRVRTRAAASPVMNGAVPAANYLVNNYTVAFADKDVARKAVRFERKLELSMEGHRYFDLVRWGTVQAEISAYLTVEAVRRPTTLNGSVFTANKHEYLPIPDFAITQSIKEGAPTLKQNPGY